MTESAAIENWQAEAAKVDAFVARFGHEDYRQLVNYAALPLVLTPELVHYLRTQFLREANVPWEAEVDLLLSDLCSQVGYELYTLDTQVRAYLLAQMKTDRHWQQRQVEVAQVLITYVSYLSRINPHRRQRELDAQRLAAMTYLGDESCQEEALEIAERLKQLESAEAQGESTHSIRAELAYLTRLTQELSPQLEATPELVEWAALVQRLLRQPEAVAEEEVARSYQVGDYTFIPSALPIELPSETGETLVDGFPPIQTLTFETGRWVEETEPTAVTDLPTLETQTVQVAELYFEDGFDIEDTSVPMEFHELTDSETPSEIGSTSIVNLETPEGAVPLSSDFYVERPNTEKLLFYEAIEHPRQMPIIISAPHQMGKTSLLLRVIDYAQDKGHKTAYLNCQTIDSDDLDSYRRFLYWFCHTLTEELGLSNQLQSYWGDNSINSGQNVSSYIKSYVLPEANAQCLIVFDDADRLHENPNIARDFYSLIRSWYDVGQSQNSIWNKLSIIIAISEDFYARHESVGSPLFNICHLIRLREFDEEEIVNLAQRHGLSLSNEELKLLADMIGGHPHLIRTALYELARGNTTLDKLLNEAPTNSGIFRKHLRSCLFKLQSNTDLMEAFTQVVNADKPIKIGSREAYRLECMGLVKEIDGKVSPSSILYRQYFQNYLNSA